MTRTPTRRRSVAAGRMLRGRSVLLLMPPRVGVLISLLVFVYGAPAARRTVETKEMAFGGKLRFTFDPSVISEEEVLRLAVLSPNHDDVADYYLAPAVEGCVEGSPEYLPCGDRRPTAENFYRNAEVNLSKGRRKLAELNQFHVPPELLPVIHFMKESFGFTLWVQESRLAYFRSGGSLPGRYHDVDFSGPCSAIIRETVQARSPEERYAAAFKWQSCVNGEFRGRRGLKGWLKGTRSGPGNAS